MPKSWKEVLEDSKAFPNELNVPVAEGISLTMGELRAIDAERRKQLDEQAGVLDRAAGAIAKLYEDAEKARTRAVPTPTPTPNPTPNVDANLESDPLFAPIFKQVKAMDERLNATLSKFEKIPATMTEAMKLYEQDRMADIFDRLPDKPSDLTLQKLAEFALEHGKRDKINRLDLRAAYDEMRRPDIVREQIEAAKREGMEEGKKSAAIESAPKPRFIKPKDSGEKHNVGSVREAMSAMRSDPKLMADLNESIAALSSSVH
ncbi:MAG TPA: hypothetical protein VGT24_01560 [Candidatus Acidoferrales bacterium]|nr:hypothetical protein [Candidatus Acidoferrales bacterium]